VIAVLLSNPDSLASDLPIRTKTWVAASDQLPNVSTTRGWKMKFAGIGLRVIASSYFLNLPINGNVRAYDGL
jgi:hypothetical protein